MTHETARTEIRRRQTKVACRVAEEIYAQRGEVTDAEINEALVAEGLPPAEDNCEMDDILNGRSFDVSAEQYAFEALMAEEVASFLRENGYKSLADASDKLNSTFEETWGLVQKRLLKRLGYADGWGRATT